MKGRQESAEMVRARRDGRLPLWEERGCRPAVVNWFWLRTGQGQLQRQCHLHYYHSLQALQHRRSQLGALMKDRAR